jgi:hypothetical protein
MVAPYRNEYEPKSLAVIRSLRKRPASRKNTVEAAAEATRVALRDLFITLSDDICNAAVASNPTAFATTQGRDTIVQVADANEVQVYQNDLLVPVALVIRADGDITDVRLSSANGSATDKQIRGWPLVEAILQPRQKVYANVSAVAFPCRLVVTAIPMQGRRTLHGSIR